MKILVAGDLHGDIVAAKNLSEKAESEKVDMVLLSGDLTMFGKNHEGLLSYFAKKGITTGLIHGNHEDLSIVDFLSEKYGMKNLHGTGILDDAVGIFGCGGANIGLNQLTEKEIYDTLLDAFYSIYTIGAMNKKIMITHVHPSGTSIESMSKFVRGSTGLRRAVERLKPDFLFCSHVHEAQGLEEMIGSTKVFCVGKTGKIFDL